MRSLLVLLLTACGVYAEAPLPRYPDRSNLLVWKDDAGKAHPVTKPEEWLKRRRHILEGMQEVMGQLPSDKEKVPLDVKYLKEEATPKYVRKKLTFAVETGDRVPAWLLVPRDLKGKAPAVLCLHQTINIGKDEPVGLGKNQDLAYAHHLAERGYVALAPDYPSFGEYAYDFAKSKFASGSMKAIWNNMRAVDLLAALPEVDAERIGAIGHSLGGHNAMFTAVFDERLKAVVSNCGFTSAFKYYGGNLKGWTSARYMPRVARVHGNKPDRLPFDFPEIVAAFAPRAFLASSPLHDDNFEVSGVRDCIAAAKPVYDLLGVKEKLKANYPDCKHEFPEDVRKVAYEFLDRWLKDQVKVKLTVRETAGLRRFDYPVHGTLTLPRPLTSADRFALLDKGNLIVTQFRPAGASGTNQVALDFTCSILPFAETTYLVEVGPGVTARREPVRGVEVQESKEAITVGLGDLRYVVPRDMKGLLSEVQGGTLRYLKTRQVKRGERSDGLPAGLWLQFTEAEKSYTRQLGAGKWRITRQGPLAAALRYDGALTTPGGEDIPVSVEMDFPRSKSWVEFDVRVKPSKAVVSSLIATFDLETEAKPTLVDFGASSIVYTTLQNGETAYLSSIAGHRHAWEVMKAPFTASGSPLAVAPKGTKREQVEGWMHLMDEKRCTAIAVAGFGTQGDANGLTATAWGSCVIKRTFSERDAGERRLRFWMHFVPMPVQVGALTSPQSMMAPLAVEAKVVE